MLDLKEYEEIRQSLIDIWQDDLHGLLDILGVTVADILDNFEWEDNERLQDFTYGTSSWGDALQEIRNPTY